MIPNYKMANGVEIPVLGLGTYLTKNGEVAAQTVRDAVEVGYRSIDTAWFYGNEEGLGEGIRTCGLDRKEIYITSKLWNAFHGYEATLTAFEDSLKRLGVDYLDEYLIHWPGQVQSYLPTWKAFEKLYKDGRIRVIGVSNFTRDLLTHLLENCDIKPMVDQIEVNPVFQPNTLIAFCQENDILVEGWRPLVWGQLEKEPIIAASKKHGKTLAQVALRWQFQKNLRTLPKTTHKDRMIENINIFDFELSEEEISAIDGLNTWIRTGESPDEFFWKG